MEGSPWDDSRSFRRFSDFTEQATAGFALGARPQTWRPRMLRPPLEVMFDAVRVGALGRRVVYGEGEGAVAFTLAQLDASFDSMGAAAGQADNVRVAAEGVAYAGLWATRVEATLSNVHTRIGVSPVLVASPVDVAVVLGRDEAEAVARHLVPGLNVRCAGSERVRVSLRRFPRRMWIEATVSAVSGRLVARLARIGCGRWGIRLGKRLPAYTIPLALRPDLRLVEVLVEQELITVRLRADELQVPYSQVFGLARRQA